MLGANLHKDRPITDELTREYQIAWYDPKSKASGFHVDTLTAAAVAAAYAEDEDEYIAMIGLRDPDAEGEVCDVFRERFEAIREELTLDEYEHELRMMYRRFGGRERVAKLLEDFERQQGMRIAA